MNQYAGLTTAEQFQDLIESSYNLANFIPMIEAAESIEVNPTTVERAIRFGAHDLMMPSGKVNPIAEEEQRLDDHFWTAMQLAAGKHDMYFFVSEDQPNSIMLGKMFAKGA